MKKFGVLSIVGAMGLAMSSTAQAQVVEPATEGSAALGSSLLSSTIGVPLTGLGVAIYGIVTTARGGSGGDVAEVYLRQNAAQLAQDLTAGDGRTLLDLASAAEIRAEDYAVFASQLRAHRAELLALADASQLTRERAVSFMARVGELVKSHQTLAANYQSFLARHGLKG